MRLEIKKNSFTVAYVVSVTVCLKTFLICTEGNVLSALHGGGGVPKEASNKVGFAIKDLHIKFLLNVYIL